MGLLTVLEKGWDSLFGSVTASPGYDSVSSSGGFFTQAWDKTASFLGSDAGKATAGFAGKAIFGDSSAPKFNAPKGQRISAPGGSASARLSQAGAVDMGITARVQNAARIAQNNSVAGSSIRGTIERLSSRPSRGPLLSLASSSISMRRKPV